MNHKKEIDFLSIMVVLMFAFFVFMAVYNMQKDLARYKTVSYTSIVLKKHQEIESINLMGASRTNYYIMYDDGTINKVDVNTFIMLNVGDEVRRTKRVLK